MTAWLFDALLASTVLMAAVLLARGVTAKLFGPRAAYLLWLLPALRVALPPLPGVPGGLAFLVPDAGTAQAVGDAGAATNDGVSALLLLWAAGGILFAAWQLLGYRVWLGRALRRAVPMEGATGALVLISPAVTGPVATGVLRPRILLPSDFGSRYSTAERRACLLHESAHHARRDLLANLLALMVLSLHWWNPLAHFAYRAFRSDQEAACDAAVLEALTPEQRGDYGRALLKTAAGRLPVAACGFNARDALKSRLLGIGRPSISAKRSAAGFSIALFGVIGGLGLTATRQAPAAPKPETASQAPIRTERVALVQPPARESVVVATPPPIGAVGGAPAERITLEYFQWRTVETMPSDEPSPIT